MCAEPTGDCPAVTFSAVISSYRTYLKTVYKNSPISLESKWPPTPSKKYISLAVVEGRSKCRDDFVGHTLHGNLEQVLENRKEISIEKILEPSEGLDTLQMVFIEGAPGIGKSTLAWELCRKWEEFSCMKGYSLVILLRLREEEVQAITKVSDLFCFCESEKKERLVEEVSESQGKGVLLMLDGFDELPKSLQSKGFILDLIKGIVLPASTVLVTSRPSATAGLLASCGPRIQKRIEILGFTQESIEAYASSVFSSEPEELKRFKAYISGSDNPAINSLMYVPLNAAIVVQVFRDCESDRLLPHTLTELYTYVSLTYLNRYLQSKCLDMVSNFEELPSDLYQQLACLSEVAFEGIVTQRVIFHALPTSLVHFGFLDAVSALYGGGRISYNFLHLTLQEFFAAYHISRLREGGIEVFNQHCEDERWNVVWRFVAGLTKFEYYIGHVNRESYIYKEHEGTASVNLFFIQCLYEAQSACFDMNPFSDMWGILGDRTTPLDRYALGYCVSAVPMAGKCWNVSFHYSTNPPKSSNISTSFLCGLKACSPAVNVLGKLKLANVNSLSIADLKFCSLEGLTLLQLTGCFLTNTDFVHLSELIPCLPKLLELDVSYNMHFDCQDGLIMVLQQLRDSNVTTLDITSTLQYLPDDEKYYSALEALIHPSSGRLEVLKFGNKSGQHDQRACDVLASPSSLRSLCLSCSSYFSLLGFESNTNIHQLDLQIDQTFISFHPTKIEDVIRVLNSNKTVQEISIKPFPYHDLACIKNFVGAVRENKTLQKVKVYLKKSMIIFSKRVTLNSEITEEFSADSRIVVEPYHL